MIEMRRLVVLARVNNGIAARWDRLVGMALNCVVANERNYSAVAGSLLQRDDPLQSPGVRAPQRCWNTRLSRRLVGGGRLTTLLRFVGQTVRNGHHNQSGLPKGYRQVGIDPGRAPGLLAEYGGGQGRTRRDYSAQALRRLG